MTPPTTGSAITPGRCLGPYDDRVTLVRNEHRRGGMYNTWNAVTNFCADPESVVITLDADDAMIGEHVLERCAGRVRRWRRRDCRVHAQGR